MSSAAEKAKYLPVVVEKPIPVTFDLGNLAVFDSNTLDANELDSSNAQREQNIQSIVRDNVQLMINQILSLPLRTTTDSNGSSGQGSSMTLVQLPEPTSELPREKPLPKPKPPTKWELFAAKKGIKSKEKSGKMVFDEATGKWVPKWGFKGANKKLDDQWLVEVDESKNKKEGDELIDPRTLSRTERKMLIKKNELQHKRNLKENK
ncbi:LAMI_0C05138g1_1 [Lachancea mirantina]|uniref:Ribosome biogenesis regulatory protein n=1 Tax=Lachancea mirantina TaxID=1230905 RepID=A0A1G4J323_9SACH|nr:LAMI_0C05138g1_1 [Lachancea mirantina]